MVSQWKRNRWQPTCENRPTRPDSRSEVIHEDVLSDVLLSRPTGPDRVTALACITPPHKHIKTSQATYISIPTHTHTHTHAHRDTCTQQQTNIDTHMQTPTHTHTHTHTHTKHPPTSFEQRDWGIYSPCLRLQTHKRHTFELKRLNGIELNCGRG